MKVVLASCALILLAACQSATITSSPPILVKKESDSTADSGQSRSLQASLNGKQSRPKTEVKRPPPAVLPSITYSLPKSLIKVQGGTCLGETDVTKCTQDSTNASYNILVTTEIVADPQARITSTIQKSDWSTDKQVFKTNSMGLLTSSTTDATDQTQAIVVSIFQAAVASGRSPFDSTKVLSFTETDYESPIKLDGQDFDPRKHKLGSFSTYCDGFSRYCEIRIPVEGRLASEVTEVIVKPAAKGTRADVAYTNKQACEADDSDVVCNRQTSSRTYLQEKTVFEEVRTTETIFSPLQVSDFRRSWT